MDWKQIEVESIIEPLDTSKKGMEFVLRIGLDWDEGNDVFYTDRNGLDMQKRIINTREDFEIRDNVPVSSNMYPVTSCLQVFKYPTSKEKKFAL